MAVTVEFITLGDASKHLGIPAPTLRLWTDELEKYDVHYVMRNQRDERIYYEGDLEIFAFMKKLKDEYKRKLRTEDVAKMIYQQATEQDMFDLRRAEDAPRPEVQDKHLELLNDNDIYALMESHKVKQFMGHIMDDVRKEMDNRFTQQNKALIEAHEKLERTVQDNQEAWLKRMDERFNQTNEYIAELRAKRQPKWWEFWK